MELQGALHRRRVATVLCTVATLHALGWGLFLHFAGSTYAVTYVGAAAVAYALGLRHAFDADHIAAIDDTARLLIQRGEKPWAAGLYFSLGHASVVLALCVVVTFGAPELGNKLESLRNAGSNFSGVIAAAYLYLVAALNLRGLIRAHDRSARPVGPLQSLLGARVLGMVRSERRLFGLGLLLGLGFDTASEIAILGLTASATSRDRLPWMAALSLPLLFAAGMSLLDSLDGVLMVHLYGWADLAPHRRQTYARVAAALSVIIAFAVGTIELVRVCTQFDPQSALRRKLEEIDAHSSMFGAAIIAIFVITWVGFALVARRATKGRRAVIADAG
jgi:high-affinity nickel-transport protein